MDSFLEFCSYVTIDMCFLNFSSNCIYSAFINLPSINLTKILLLYINQWNQTKGCLIEFLYIEAFKKIAKFLFQLRQETRAAKLGSFQKREILLSSKQVVGAAEN